MKEEEEKSKRIMQMLTMTTVSTMMIFVLLASRACRCPGSYEKLGPAAPGKSFKGLQNIT